MAALVNKFINNSNDYFALASINKRLADENRVLREQITDLNLKVRGVDSVDYQYVFQTARVINSTFRRSMNYLTLNVGSQSGVKPGMGVITGRGAVGQVKSVSNHFCTVTSLLHRNLLISATVGKTKSLCTIQWDGVSPREAELKYLPRHVKLEVGDTVVTSGYNAVFPPGIMIGTVSEFSLEREDVFYQAKIRLSVDFSAVDYVFLVDNKLKQEQDSLEQTIQVQQ